MHIHCNRRSVQCTWPQVMLCASSSCWLPAYISIDAYPKTLERLQAFNHKAGTITSSLPQRQQSCWQAQSPWSRALFCLCCCSYTRQRAAAISHDIWHCCWVVSVCHDCIHEGDVWYAVGDGACHNYTAVATIGTCSRCESVPRGHGMEVAVIATSFKDVGLQQLQHITSGANR